MTNVSGAPLTVSASITGLAAMTAVVSPVSLALRPGQTASFEVTFSNVSATPGSYVGGQHSVAGQYTVVVQGWGVVGTSPFKLHTWLLGSTSEGNMTVTAPASQKVGTAGQIDLSRGASTLPGASSSAGPHAAGWTALIRRADVGLEDT